MWSSTLKSGRCCVQWSYRAQQLVPHLARTSSLRLHVHSLRGGHPLVGYRGRSPGGEELVG